MRYDFNTSEGLNKRTKACEKQALFPIGDINKLTYYFRVPTVIVILHFLQKGESTFNGLRGYRVWCFCA